MTYDDLLTHPILSREEEIELAHRLKAGDQSALDKLVSHNMRLVHKCARGYFATDPAMSFDDLMQEGAIGLITAARKFDPERGFRFSTYATFWIRQKIGRACLISGPIRRSANPHQWHHQRPESRRAHELRQSPVFSLDEPLLMHNGDDGSTLADIIADDCPPVEDQVLSSIEVERILKALHLTPKSESIVRDFLSGLTQLDAQRLNGVSRSYIRSTLDQHKWRVAPISKTTARTCIEPGCDQHRFVNENGKLFSRCHEHQRQFWREAAAARSKKG